MRRALILCAVLLLAPLAALQGGDKEPPAEYPIPPLTKPSGAIKIDVGRQLFVDDWFSATPAIRVGLTFAVRNSMIERTSRICLAVGFAAGLCAIALALIGGTHFRWAAGESGTKIEIQIGADAKATAKALGSVAIVGLVLGSAFWAVSRQPASGNATPGGATGGHFSFLTFLQDLRKSHKDCQLGGVCGGLGEHCPVPSWVWRVLFVVLALCFGVGLIPYLILWICMPEAKTQDGGRNADKTP